jgi:uncharacterized membrane protein YhaH (DUF805 family)
MSIRLIIICSLYKYYRNSDLISSSTIFKVGIFFLTILTIVIFDIFAFMHNLGFGKKFLKDVNIPNSRLIFFIIGFPLVYGLIKLMPNPDELDKIQLNQQQYKLGLFIAFGVLMVSLFVLIVLIVWHNNQI